MSSINTVLPASAGDTTIQANTKTIFGMKIVLPLATDETK
jgi:hypothetical protein